MITLGTKAKNLMTNDTVAIADNGKWWIGSIVAMHVNDISVNVLLTSKDRGDRKVWFYSNEVVNKVVG